MVNGDHFWSIRPRAPPPTKGRRASFPQFLARYAPWRSLPNYWVGLAKRFQLEFSIKRSRLLYAVYCLLKNTQDLLEELSRSLVMSGFSLSAFSSSSSLSYCSLFSSSSSFSSLSSYPTAVFSSSFLIL